MYKVEVMGRNGWTQIGKSHKFMGNAYDLCLKLNILYGEKVRLVCPTGRIIEWGKKNVA